MTLPLLVVPSSEDAATEALLRGLTDGKTRLAFLPASGPERERLLAAADALLVFAWRVRDDEIPLLVRCRHVQSVWAGTDRIPAARLEAAHPGLRVASGSGPNASQVAEHAIGMYLDLAKRITWRDREMRAGRWQQEVPGRRLAGTRVAVVGFGAIGARVARGLAALDVEVTAVNRSGTLGVRERTHGATHATTLDGLRDELALHAGCILALPLTPATEAIVGRSWLEAMPRDGMLVNVARGGLVVADELAAHLERHPEFMAGIDTWWRYPTDDATITADMKRFLGFSNVVLTPHSAYNVPGARDEMVRAATRNVMRLLAA